MKRTLSIALTFLLLASVLPVQALELSWQSKVDDSVLQAASAGPTDFIVYMQRRADLSDAARLPSKEAKGSFVYQRLNAVAQDSQQALIGQLTDLGVEHQSYWITNAVVVYGANMEVLRSVAERDDVANVFALGRGEL